MNVITGVRGLTLTLIEILSSAAIDYAQVIQQATNVSNGFLSSLSDEERKGYDGLKADWDEKRRADPKGFARLQAKLVIEAQMTLGRFGYGTKFTGVVDSQTQDALRNYQANKGITLSGSLDALTFFALDHDNHVADQRFIDYASYSFDWQENYASFGGAWDRMNDSETYVVSSDLECDKGRKACIETEAIAARVFGIDMINSNRIDFFITKWDEYELIAEDTSPDCERDELRVNRQEKSVLLISTPTYKNDSCKKILGKPETVTYKLVDGTKIFRAREEAAAKQKTSLYQFSPTARAILNAKE